MNFRVFLSSLHSQAVTVNYATTSVGATDPAVGGLTCDPYTAVDYEVPTAGSTVTIPIGSIEAFIPIAICGEAFDVADAFFENFFVTISSPTGGAILGASQSTGVIGDAGALSP
jgi:hypothetical protein